MYRRLVSVYAVFTFICIIVSSLVHADESKTSNIKTINQGVSYEADDTIVKSVKTDQQNQVQRHPGLLYKPFVKDAIPQKTGFIRLKPRPVANGENKGQIVYDIEFTDSETSEKRVDGGPDDKPYVAIEKVEPIDKGSFMKKETARENKAEVSLGYKLSDLSEIYLGKGFLVERKDNSTIQTHDDGWRIKFKTHF